MSCKVQETSCIHNAHICSNCGYEWACVRIKETNLCSLGNPSNLICARCFFMDISGQTHGELCQLTNEQLQKTLERNGSS